MDKLKTIFLLTAILLVWASGFAAAIQADTYYVDNGHPQASDTNPGTQTLPWVNCPGMTGWRGNTSLKPGDTVFFNSMSTWTFSSGDYGLNIQGGVRYIGDSWGSGTRAHFRLLTDMNNMIQWYDDDPVHETVFQGFEIDANNHVATGIGINHPGWSYENSPLNGATKRIQNCVIHDQFCISGRYTYGIIISSWGDSAQPCPGSLVRNVEILNNVVYNQGRNGIILYPANNNDTCFLSDILIRGNVVYDTGQQEGYDAGCGIGVKNHVKDVIIEYNYIHGYHGSTGQCSLFSADVPNSSGPGNIVFRYNILTTTSPTGINFWNHGNIDIQIYGNIIYNIDGRMGIMANYNLDNSFNALIYNNLLYKCNLTVSDYPGSTDILKVENNIIYTESSTPVKDYAGNITSHRNNLYYSESGGKLVVSNDVAYTASTIKDYEPSSVTNHPAFVNAGNPPTGFTGHYTTDLKPDTNGLSLQSISAAIDAGINLGSPFDMSVNSLKRPQGSGWDIGPYELENAGEEPPLPPRNLRLLSTAAHLTDDDAVQ
jgi:hypothetical protein